MRGHGMPHSTASTLHDLKQVVHRAIASNAASTPYCVAIRLSQSIHGTLHAGQTTLKGLGLTHRELRSDDFFF